MTEVEVVDNLRVVQSGASKTLLQFAKIIMFLGDKNHTSKEDLETLKDVEFLCQVVRKTLKSD